MRHRVLTTGWLLLTVLSLSPLFAGTVYVPIPKEYSADGKLVTPHVLITNTHPSRPRGFTALWLQTDTDGTVREREAEPPTQVRFATTVLLNATPPEGGTGLLEISAEPELIIDARLVISDVDGGGPAQIVDLPVISSDNAIMPGKVVYLQGLERTRFGTKTDLAFINLAHQQNDCLVRVFRAGGLQVQGNFHLSFKPLTQVIFADAFALLGEEALVEARIEASCDQPFFLLATITSDDLKVARFVVPSASGASSLLRPGEVLPTAELKVSGVFLRAKQGDSFRGFDLPLEPGLAYRKIQIDFDVLVSKWHSDLFHALVSLRRKNDLLYFGAFIRGSNAKTIIDVGDGTELRDDGPWKTGRRYHVRTLYDGEQGNLTFTVLEGSRQIDTFTGPIAHLDLSDNGKQLDVVFGLSRVYDNAFFPPWGWEFSNLEVVATP